MADLRANAAPQTIEWYRYRLQLFADHLSARGLHALQVDELKRIRRAKARMARLLDGRAKKRRCPARRSAGQRRFRSDASVACGLSLGDHARTTVTVNRGRTDRRRCG